MKHLFITVFAFFCLQQSIASPVFQTVKSGLYFDASTWKGGLLPPNPIPAGTEVKILHSPITILANELVENNGLIDATGNQLINEGSLVGTGTFKGGLEDHGKYRAGKARSTELFVGMAYEGGIIAYIYGPSDPGYDERTPHGLIAATGDVFGPDAQNQDYYYQWHNDSLILSEAYGDGIAAGLTNTEAITIIQGIGVYAAMKCSDFVAGGYTDWYLPSKEELNILYQNQAAIGGFETDPSALPYYWSSTELSDMEAWAQHFGGGYQTASIKYDTFRIRPVRLF